MKSSGIYRIQSILKPERIYIGSAINIFARKQKHLSELKLGKHKNGRLQNHVNKYGVADLIFSTIESCLPDHLLVQEQYYLDKLKPYFNICKIAGNTLGIKYSEESRRKISIAKKGKPGRKLPPEEIQKLREIHKGKIVSAETREKQSIARKGKGYGFKKGYKPSIERNLKQSATIKERYPNGVHSLETMKLIGMKNKGRKMSTEHKERLRLLSIGRKHSPESLIKISNANKGNKYCLGRKVSEESRLKNRESHLGKKASLKTKNKLSLIRKGGKFSEEHKKRLGLSIKLAIARKKMLKEQTKKTA